MIRAPDKCRHYEAREARYESPEGDLLQVSVPAHERRAWRIPTESLAGAGCLAQWIVQCPFVHAAWDHWVVSAAHLRPIEGRAPAVKVFADAQYEVAVYALQPPAEGGDMQQATWLLPPDVAEQFDVGNEDDALVVAVVEALVDMVVEQELSPDSDFRSAWRPAIAYACFGAGMRGVLKTQ